VFTKRSLDLATRDFERAGGLALVVLVANEVIHQQYFQGRTRKSLHNIRSGTKAFVACAACIAVSDGLLDFDEPASNTLSEWKTDPRRSQITIRQLLSMTSGLDNSRPGAVFTSAEAVAAVSTAAPGSRYAYGSIPYQAFSEIFKRKLTSIGETPWKYLVQKLFEPLGLAPSWRLGADGDLIFSTGLELSAPDWARFGLLVKDNGVWQNRVLIPSEVLHECFKSSSKFRWFGMGFNLNPPVETNALADAFGALSGNSLEETIYIRRQKRELEELGPFPRDLIYAVGRHGQRLWIIPSTDTVIVQLAEGNEIPEGIVLSPLFFEASNYKSKGPLREMKQLGKRFLKGLRYAGAASVTSKLNAEYMTHDVEGDR